MLNDALGIRKEVTNFKNNVMDKKITRKEAIKKAGVTALAATSLVLLNTKANAGGSPYYRVGGIN